MPASAFPCLCVTVTQDSGCLGVAGALVVCLGLAGALVVCLGLTGALMVYLGLAGALVVCLGLAGVGTYLGTPSSGQDKEQAPYFPDLVLYLPVVPGGASTPHQPFPPIPVPLQCL